jgi:hypothetical protein
MGGNHKMLFLKKFPVCIGRQGFVHKSHSPLLFIKNILSVATVEVSYYAACSLFVYIIDQLYHLVSYMMALVLPMQRFADN